MLGPLPKHGGQQGSCAGRDAGGRWWWRWRGLGWVLQGCANRASPQERQRLETILNLCAEYTKTDGAELGHAPRLLAGDGDAGRQAPRGAPEELGVLRQRESLERSDEENLKEECSSTESTHHEVRGWGCPCRAVPRQPVPCHADPRSPQHEELVGPRAKEAQRLEEERACVLSRLDELKGHVKDLEQQLQEMLREVRVWGALLRSHSPCHHRRALDPTCDLRWTSSCWSRQDPSGRRAAAGAVGRC